MRAFNLDSGSEDKNPGVTALVFPANDFLCGGNAISILILREKPFGETVVRGRKCILFPSK